MKLSHWAVLAAALTLAACGGGNGADSTGTPEAVNGEPAQSAGDEPMPDGDEPMTGGNDLDPVLEEGREDPEFTAACLSASNMNEAMCRCVSRRATANLTDRSRAFLIAMLSEDAAESTRLRMEMTMPEITESGMFMVNSATDCAAEGHN